MRHTYFFETMKWTAAGTYYDEAGHPFPLKGETEIVHDKSRWTLGGYLEVAFESPVRFTNTYEIQGTEDETTLSWESFNPDLGILRGRFEVIGEFLVSSYTSADGTYSGTETLLQIDEKTYRNVGVSFHNGKKMSSWTALLKERR